MALGSKVNLRRLSKPHPDGYKWLCTFKDGTAIRKRYFTLKKDAELFRDQREAEVIDTGTGMITPAEKDAVIKLRDELQSYGLTVLTALEAILAQKRLAEQSCTIAELIRKVLQAKMLAGKSKRYLQDLESRFGQFAKGFDPHLKPKRVFAEYTVAEVTADDIRTWLHGLDVAPSTKANFLRVLAVLFSEGVTRKFCAANPAKDVDKLKVVAGETGVLTPGELSKLLEAAPDELIPFITIGAFAGLRRAEIERLDWSDIDLEEGDIKVSARNAKSAQERFVTVPDNLKDWLLPHARPSGKVTPSNYRELLDAARATADISWPHNALRHSYASYHLACYDDAGLLAGQLGHSNSKMVYDHYRKVVRQRHATPYWDIRPSASESKVRNIAS